MSTEKTIPRALTIAVLIALGVGVVMLNRFFSLIVAAMIMAYLFNPVYEWFLRRGKTSGTAAAFTLLITLFAIVVPIIIICVVTVLQASTMLNDLSNLVGSRDIGTIAQNTIDWVNNFLSSLLNREIVFTRDETTDFIIKYFSSILAFMLDILKSWAGSLAGVITGVILYMYVFTSILVNSKKITEMMQQLNPLGKDITNLYIEKTAAMTKGIVQGQFIIALAQGIESAVVLSLAGVPYFTFWLLILTFMSIIPLGAGIITIPIGMIMILTGNYVGGSIIILNHLIIVTNIDNVLRPKLVPESVKINSALILLAVFGGIALFGLLGIIIGPVLMILIITTLQLYLEETSKVKKQQSDLSKSSVN